MNPTNGVDNERYLENTLHSAKIQLENAKIDHRIAIAVFDNQQEFLQKQIDSIERQLEKSKSAKA